MLDETSALAHKWWWESGRGLISAQNPICGQASLNLGSEEHVMERYVKKRGMVFIEIASVRLPRCRDACPREPTYLPVDLTHKYAMYAIVNRRFADR